MLLLSGCTLVSQALPIAAEPETTPETPALSKPATPVIAALPAQVAVIKHFDAAKARELSAVTSPDITSEHIAQIAAADARARQALTALGQQHNHITPSVLQAARDAVRALETVLDEPP